MRRDTTNKQAEPKGKYRVKNWAQYNAGLIVRGDPIRYRYGKRVRGLVVSKLQARVGRNIDIVQASAALGVPQLQDIARHLGGGAE